MLPQRIGRYEVLGQLATGGMAEILLARLSGPAAFARAVVIKRMLRQYVQLDSFVTMFLDEARAVAKIRHPNVVQVHELGEDAGEVFLVLEYVEGENLSSVLKRSVSAAERLAPELVAYVIAEACAGLHAAHELVSDDGRHQNLVHRDVSPQNLFVAYDGHVKLLDFGVALTDERASRTQAGDVKGKFEYMSPEQARGEPLDRRSDIFAMGIVLYELGTGRRLFQRASPARTLDGICKEPVIPPSRLTPGFPPALEAIVLRALAKNPEERFATAAEMRRALLEVARELPSPVEALAERMRRWFPERIAEKAEMLRRVTAGDELSRVPTGEVDDNVRVPGVPDAPSLSAPMAVGAAGADGAGASAAAPPPVTRGARRAVRVGAGVALTLLFLGLAVLGASRLVGARAAPGDAAPPEALAVPAPTAPATLALDTAPAPPVDVVVRVESRPPGARVLADGAERGTTPIDLRLTREARPVMVELRRSGFAPALRAVVPDADQKVVVSLQRRSVRPNTSTKPSTSAPPGGFHRFD